MIIGTVLIGPVIILTSWDWLGDYPTRISNVEVVVAAGLASLVTLCGASLSAGVQAVGMARRAVTDTLRLE